MVLPPLFSSTITLPHLRLFTLTHSRLFLFCMIPKSNAKTKKKTFRLGRMHTIFFTFNSIKLPFFSDIDFDWYNFFTMFTHFYSKCPYHLDTFFKFVAKGITSLERTF